MSRYRNLGPIVLLLLLETGPDSAERWWWHCAEREAQPVSDRIAGQLERLGLSPIDRCDRLEAPIHKSFRKATLRSFEQINLANAVGASGLFAGVATLTRRAPLADIGLEHVEARLALTSVDLERGEPIDSVTLSAHGFDGDASVAVDRARELLLAQLVPLFGRLVTGPQSGPPVSRVAIRSIPRPRDLDAWLADVRAAGLATGVRVAELTRDGALLEVDPPSAEAAVIEKLKALGADASQPE